MEEQNDCLYDYISIEDDEGYGQELESGLVNQPMASSLPVTGNKDSVSDDYFMDETIDYDLTLLKARKKRSSLGFTKNTPSFNHVAIEPAFLPYGKEIMTTFQ